MFIIIAGGGKVGTYLARALLVQDHEVVVIEKVPSKAQRMADILESDVTMIGDACDPLVLDQAGIKRADVVVADTGDDEDNLVICLIAKKRSTARCIARVNNPKNKAIFESIDREKPITLVSSTEIRSIPSSPSSRASKTARSNSSSSAFPTTRRPTASASSTSDCRARASWSQSIAKIPICSSPTAIPSCKPATKSS